MATRSVLDTTREPRITLGVTWEGTGASLAAVADVAVALNVLTAIIGDEDEAPPLNIADAHHGPIGALAVLERDSAPLIISAGNDGALRSWRADGTPGELQQPDAHPDAIGALAVVERDYAPLIISAGIDGELRSWRVGSTLAALASSAAREVTVRELSLGSLEVVLHLPPDVLAAAAATATGVTIVQLAKILDAIRRLAGFPAELRLQRTQLEVEQLRANAEQLRAETELLEARARHRRRQLDAAGWQVDRAVVRDDDDSVV